MESSTIGNTPLRRSAYLSEKYQCNVYLKEEFYNLSKSSKDRPAWYMVKAAIEQKKIHLGGTFVEASSGNTGIGIAHIAAQLGYKAHIFVSQSCSQEKLAVLRKYGAHIEICDNSNGVSDPQSTQYLAQIFADNTKNTYYTNQYDNPANVSAHYETTGPEIWQQTGGRITHFFAGIGTGGTISGVGKFLKSQNPRIKIYGIEPQGSVFAHYFKHGDLPTQTPQVENIDGIGRTFIPSVFDTGSVDHIYQVSPEESAHIAKTYFLKQNERIGFSSAAVLAGLESHIQQCKPDKDAQVVLFFADHGDRYLHTLYPEAAEPHLQQHGTV